MLENLCLNENEEWAIGSKFVMECYGKLCEMNFHNLFWHNSYFVFLALGLSIVIRNFKISTSLKLAIHLSEPITIHFSQYRRFHSSLILWETWWETCRIVLFDVSWKYRSPGENGEMRDEKNDWRDDLQNANYTLLISLVLPTFFRVLVNLTISL